MNVYRPIRTVEANGRTYRIPSTPTVVVCIDGSEPGYIEAATLGGAWSLTPTASPIAYGVVGLLVAAAALWLVVRPPVRRVRTAGGASGDVTDPLASWKAMDDGQDPTESEGERA